MFYLFVVILLVFRSPSFCSCDCFSSCSFCHCESMYDSSIVHSYHPSYVKVVAPMVRYSKLPFRLLCRRYGADVAYTPMIIASSFNQSQAARDSEFTTNKQDQPLITQFAAADPIQFGNKNKPQNEQTETQQYNVHCSFFSMSSFCMYLFV